MVILKLEAMARQRHDGGYCGPSACQGETLWKGPREVTSPAAFNGLIHDLPFPAIVLPVVGAIYHILFWAGLGRANLHCSGPNDNGITRLPVVSASVAVPG